MANNSIDIPTETIIYYISILFEACEQVNKKIED